ncbi:MAG: aminoacyl-tRNA hydrolase [Pseudomonadota bacterium]
MVLIAGLGNPGKNYQNTRHNLGFLTLQALARRHQIPIEKRKFESLYGSGEILRKKVILLTPLTYMNRSGLSIGHFLRYFQIPPDHLVVVHDDLDLPWTRIRIVPKGGAAGHKGLLSIIEQLKTQEFIRIRMGISRPSGEIPPESYVLESFSTTEKKELPLLTDQACEAIEVLMEQGVTAAMNRFNAWKSPTEA